MNHHQVETFIHLSLERRMFPVSVQDRSADTLRAIIQDHVLP